ncbi:MAG: hypothetical protein ACJAZO_004144 [Myxococcota bacterium]|jgi:hypothetical protein
MYSIFAAVGAAAIAFVLVSLLMNPVAAMVPAVLAMGIVGILLLRRATNGAQVALAPMQALMQDGKIEEVDALLVEAQNKWGKWMPTLTGQLHAQRGMLDYVRQKWDDALPKLQKGKWRNWMAQGCIASIHYRRGDKETAFTMYAGATKAGKKEPLAWIVRSVMLNKDGKRDEALTAVNEGLTHIPGNRQLLDLQQRIANKKRIDTARFGQGWYQFFPEELGRQMQASRGSNPSGGGFQGGGRTSKAQRRGR